MFAVLIVAGALAASGAAGEGKGGVAATTYEGTAGVAATTYDLTHPAPPLRVAELDADGLLAGHESSPVRGDRLALSPDLFAADAMIWDELASRSLTYRGMNGVALEIAFPDTPFLGIWQKPGANFLCIEPWAGHADPAGFTGEFREKPGIMVLEPGGERSFRMDVTVVQG